MSFTDFPEYTTYIGLGDLKGDVKLVADV